MTPNDQLCIHPDYVQRSDPTHFDDRNMRDVWQDEVYAFARKCAVSIDAKTIADYGCGSGYKLMKYFSGFETIGFELEPSLTYLRTTYRDRVWASAAHVERISADMMICADVIEHIPDPLPFLDMLKKGPCQRFVFSTPALEILAERGASPRLGPPNNTSHVREWTTLEFRSFMEMHFKVFDQLVINCVQGTQLLLAELK